MANNPSDGASDEFLEHLLGLPNFATAAEAGLAPGDGTGLSVTAATPMMLQLGSGDGSGGHGHGHGHGQGHLSALGGGGAGAGGGGGGGGGGYHGAVFPLGLSLEQGKGGGFLKPEEASGSGKRYPEEVVDGRASTVKNLHSPLPNFPDVSQMASFRNRDGYSFVPTCMTTAHQALRQRAAASRQRSGWTSAHSEFLPVKKGVG